jgi:hypothetical protein
MTERLFHLEGAAIMRPLPLILCPALLLAASAAGAQTQAQGQDYPRTEPESISQVQVVAPSQTFQFRDYEADAISGGYKMSNGWRMKVDPASDGIVAQIDKQHPIRLVALSRDLYATRDGNVTMEFNRGPLGEDMVMSYVPGTRTAQVVVTSTSARLAQR